MDLKIYDEIGNIMLEFELEIQMNKAIILNESDFKCQLFRQLYAFNEIKETSDYGIFGNQIHTEIKFYDEKNQLKLIPDITIIETRNLSILKSIEVKVVNGEVKYSKLPSKQYQFSGNSTIFELKYIRNKRGITSENIKSFQKDIDKINNLQKLNFPNGNNIYGVFLILNKTNLKNINFENFINENSSEKLKIIYLTQNVIF